MAVVNAHQELLLKCLESIFVGDQIFINSKKNANFKYPDTNYFMEFDIWIPKYNICFEFQDSYHYVTTWYYQHSQNNIQQKDQIKRDMAREKEITLIEIPCWWNGNINSLRDTINFYQPDVFLNNKNLNPISLNPPAGKLEASEIPNVGELMLASFPTTPLYKSSFSDSWWVGEKYDGIRCCWNPLLSLLFTRQGRVIPLDQKIIARFPSIFLDSEIWFGRGQYILTYILLKSSPSSVQWDSFRIISFDNPGKEFEQVPLEERYAEVINNIECNHPWNLLAARLQCCNYFTANKIAKEIIDHQGEGIILQQSDSNYERGRSQLLIKMKASQGDQEAIVVSIGDDYSVYLKLPNGKTFVVPAADVQTTTPKKGEIVTVSYESYARRELPTNPKIIRIRSDISWQDVLNSAQSDKKSLNESSLFTSQPLGHWNPQNMRLFLETFAKSRNLDPLSPETWYRTPSSEIRKLKGGAMVLRGSYFETISTLFPEIKLNKETYRRYLWEDKVNRRRFFENYAKANEFNPLLADNWYSQPRDKITSIRASRAILSYHEKSVAKALIDLFPEVGLQKAKFQWSNWKASVARKFFDSFAARYKFDPLNIENWYLQSIGEIMSFSGASRLMSYYGGSLWRALGQAYPQSNFDQSKFYHTFASPRSRKLFFEEYARFHSFDPFLPENWYTQSLSQIKSFEGAVKVIGYHNGSVRKALIDLFPEIGLVKDKFSNRKLWSDSKKRKQFFEDYAIKNGFNVREVDRWYQQSKDMVMNYDGGARVLHYHNNSVSQALVDLFPEYGFNKSKFIKAFHYTKDRRKFFEQFAEDNGFNPLVADNWYCQSSVQFLSTQGADSVLSHHKRNFRQALFDLFPDIGLVSGKFQAKMPYWEDTRNRRKFFEEYATKKGFDVNSYADWKHQSNRQIMTQKGAHKVMLYHNNSISQALLDLFSLPTAK